jgi:hypothetical protein
MIGLLRVTKSESSGLLEKTERNKDDLEIHCDELGRVDSRR